MSETWTEIATDIRDAGSPITSSLMARYWERDEALRECYCQLPTGGGSTSSGSWATMSSSFIWVPTWAVDVNISIGVYAGVGDSGQVKAVVNAAESSVLHVSWSSTLDKTLSVTITPSDVGTLQELIVQGKASTGTLFMSRNDMWWSQ